MSEVKTKPALSLLDRLLPVWILLAMAAGLLLGRLVPGLNEQLSKVQISGVSLPIFVGLLAMMYPVLAKVRYDETARIASNPRQLWLSLLLNWIIGPALMFTLAWVFVPDLPELRTGLIIVGLARCIAMVLIWNDLACGDSEFAAVLVAINSIFQVLAFGALGWFYLEALPTWLGLGETTQITFDTWEIVKSVLIFLGIPLIAGALTRYFGEKSKGRTWYEQEFLPKIGPMALGGLLFTIVFLFALQGDQITRNPMSVVRVAVPLLVYFVLMFFVSLWAAKTSGMSYQPATTVAFTAAGNNFELAIAVCIATFGITSGQALAGVIGPLIEVPILLGLVYVALYLKKSWFKES